jgi:hypothetical protein
MICMQTQWNIIQLLRRKSCHFVKTWGNQENIIVSKIQDSKRQILHDFTYMQNLTGVKLIKAKYVGDCQD